MKRRTWLLGGGALVVAAAVGAFLAFDDEEEGVPVTLGPARLVLPLLRYSLRGQERLIAMVRRSETETLPAGETRAPQRGDRLEVRGFDAATLAPLFLAPVASVAVNGAASAGLLGEHAATIWVFADTIGAVSAVDGQVLIERQGLVTLTPTLAGALAQPRLSIRLETEGLVLQTPDGPQRFHPRTLRAEALPASSEALPAPRSTAPYDTRAALAFRTNEARLGETWFGLAPTASPPSAATRRLTIPGTRFLAGTGQPSPTAQRLWRASLARTAAAPPPSTPDAGFQSSSRTPPPASPVMVLRLDALTALPFEAGGLGQAGFLTLGTQPDSPVFQPHGAPGLLILHRTGEGTLGLTRIDAQGSPGWTTALPIDRLVSCIPGDGPLLLAGTSGVGAEILVAVALDSGAITTRAVAA